MRNRKILLAFFLILSRFVFAQTNLDSLYAAIVEDDGSKVVSLIEKIEMNYHQMQDDEKCDFLYLKGIYLERSNKVDEALGCFRLSIEIANNLRRFDQSFYDAILRVALWSMEKKSYYESVKYGFIATNTPTKKQREYSNMHQIYSTLVSAMLYSGQIADIPDVAEKGIPFIKEQVLPNDDEYYTMPLGEAMAWLMMGNAEKAEIIYDTLCKENTISPTMQSSLNALHQEIVRAKATGWEEMKARRFEQIDNIGKNMLLVNPSTTEGCVLWKDYFSMIRKSLEFFHFDAFDPKDEALWTKTIANMIVRLYVQCDSLPERESIEYDNILCCKNFLYYHYGFHRKEPINWRDIQDVLNDDEVAIEISCVPEDILIIRKNEPQPICIRIDSLLFEEINQFDNKDAISIDKFYSPDGVMTKLWNIIEPALGTDIHAIYISGSNFFSEINYGAVALGEGSIVSDKYDIHIMLSTSDVIEYKQIKKNTYKSACLIGGVDYNESKLHSDENRNKFKDAEWNFTPILPKNMRGGFHYLPNTLKEVNEISHIMDSIGIVNALRTGKEATEEFVKSISNQSPDIIHLATHGFMLAPLFNDTTGQKLKDDLGTQYQTVLSQSGLLLAGANKKWEKDIRQKSNDGVLSSQEIAELNLSNTNLAVLMACKSGLGGTTNLTGVPFGVAFAFRMAGVKQILCCLWEVDDEVTSTMVNDFYHNLFTTNNAKKALEQSRHKLIEQGYTSPFYWAPFVLIE